MIELWILAAAFGVLGIGAKLGPEVRRAYKARPLHETWTGKPGKPIARILAEGVTRKGKYSNEALNEALGEARRQIANLQHRLEAAERREQTLQYRIYGIKGAIAGIGFVTRIDCTMEHCVYYSAALDDIENAIGSAGSL